MKYRIMLAVCFSALLMAGCGDETNNYPETGAETPAVEETTDELFFPCREQYQLAEVACMVKLYDEDYLLSYEPELVAKRIYEHALSALDQCFDFGKVSEIYRYSMEKLNAIDGTKYTPEQIEEYFFERMRMVLGYDPTRICPGGCGNEK